MAGVPALRSTAIRLPVSSSETRSQVTAQTTAAPSASTALRRVEPVVPAASARPQDQATAMLLAMARDQVVIEANASGTGTSATGHRPTAGYATQVCHAYRRHGGDPELYDQNPVLFRVDV